MSAPALKLTPTDAASVLWAVHDMDTDAAARRFVDLLGLDREAEGVLSRLLWECWAQGYCEGHDDCVNERRHKVLRP